MTCVIQFQHAKIYFLSFTSKKLFLHLLIITILIVAVIIIIVIIIIIIIIIIITIIIIIIIGNGKRTEWSPIRSVIKRGVTKWDDRAAGVRFVYHEYDYRPNWTTRNLITNSS